MIPQIIPLASDTPRLRQPVSRSPVARRHANALSTKAAQIPMALRHRERRVARRSAHTFEANTSHDTTKHPAHQQHAAFTPPCFVLPSGTAPRKRTFHQGHANPNGTATSRTSCRHTVCPHTRSSHASASYETSSKSHASRLQDERFVRDFLQKARVKSPKRAFRTRLPPKVTRPVSKTSVSYETSSKSHMSSLQNERFVRDFLKNSHVKVCKRSVSYKTSSKCQAQTPIGAHTSRSPAKQFRDSSPSKQHPLTRQSQCDSDIHLYHSSQPHDFLRLPRLFPRPHAYKVLRLPRNVISVTPCNLTIPCARHENRTSTSQNTHKVLRLPRKVTISSHVSFNKICTTPHVWNDFDPF